MMFEMTYTWMVKRVSEEFYWDNYVLALFGSRDEACNFSDYLKTVGITTKVERSTCFWEELLERVKD